MAKPRYGITTKQKLFVQEYVKNKGNGTQAALKTYDTNKPEVAKSIATENLSKPNVKEELDRILSKESLKLEKITDNIASIAVEKPYKGYSDATILEANKTLLKLHGVLTNRKTVTNYNINANLSSKSTHELVEMRKRKLQETDAILDGEVVDQDKTT